MQAIQMKLADMELRIESARLLMYKAAFLKDEHKPYTKVSNYQITTKINISLVSDHFPQKNR